MYVPIPDISARVSSSSFHVFNSDNLPTSMIVFSVSRTVSPIVQLSMDRFHPSTTMSSAMPSTESFALSRVFSDTTTMIESFGSRCRLNVTVPSFFWKSSGKETSPVHALKIYGVPLPFKVIFASTALASPISL